MGTIAAQPNHSDGVTFSAYVLANNEEMPLMREHYAQAEWKDFAFDLTPRAGQDITLRIQAEPGPATTRP